MFACGGWLVSKMKKSFIFLKSTCRSIYKFSFQYTFYRKNMHNMKIYARAEKRKRRFTQTLYHTTQEREVITGLHFFSDGSGGDSSGVAWLVIKTKMKKGKPERERALDNQQIYNPLEKRNMTSGICFFSVTATIILFYYGSLAVLTKLICNNRRRRLKRWEWEEELERKKVKWK